MPYFISGVTADHTDLIARTPEEFRAKNSVDVLTGHRVTLIDPDARRVSGERRISLKAGSSEFNFWAQWAHRNLPS
jgi:NADPH-dependent 2,4-dienoyl-CoA reductase/sulfur reductase-like enzyme